MADPKRGEILLIDYSTDGRPLSVLTTNPTGEGRVWWHFTKSRREGATYLEQEHADDPVTVHAWARKRPLHPVWHVDGLDLRRFSHHETEGKYSPVYVPITPRDYARLGRRRIPKPLSRDPFRGAVELEGDSLEYCAACGDDMLGDNLCRHLRWGDGGLVGPGSQENGAGVPEGFKWVVRRIGCARALRRMLRGAGERKSFVSAPLIGTDSIDLQISGVDFSRAANRLHDADVPESVDLREGIAWLLGLDERTKAANALALRWLDKEVARQDARRVSGERRYAVRAGGWGEEWVVRGVSWAEAVAALRALPIDERGWRGYRAAVVWRPRREVARKAA